MNLIHLFLYFIHLTTTINGYENPAASSSYRPKSLPNPKSNTPPCKPHHRTHFAPDMSPQSLHQTLAERAWGIRRNALLMGEVQGQGYIGQALDIADVLAVAYFHAMRYDFNNAQWEGRDRFLMSNGHYAIALYAALVEGGLIPKAEMETYGSDDSRLPMSGMASYTPGMEMSGGSLGQGMTIAVGRALGLKRKQSDARVFLLFSDGELDEGAMWEGMMSAAHYKLDNLIAIVDVNNQQADGPSHGVMAFEPLADKMRAFGWYTQRIDGNDLGAVITAFDNATQHKEACPRIIICDTKMGYGVPFLEEREQNHFIRVDANEWQLALSELDAHFGERSRSHAHAARSASPPA
jgi:transketolase